MTERVECTDPGCDRTILPSTAEDTGGLCMSCVQAKARREHRARIAAQRVEVNRFEGITDPVEIARLQVEHVPWDELKVDVPYPRSLFEVVADVPPERRQELLDHAVTAVRSKDDDTVEGGKNLAYALLVAGVDIGEVLLALLEVGDPYPAQLYFEAGEPVVTKLLGSLKGRVREALLPHAIYALASTRAPAAIARFREWRGKPPKFTEQLHRPIEEALHDAGLALRGDECVDLTWRTCRPLSAAEGDSETPAAIFQPAGTKCGFCGDELALLFDLDPTHEDLAFLAIDWPRLRIPICARCTCFGYLFFDLTPDGGFTWSQANVRPDYIADGEWGEFPAVRCALGPARHPAAAADWGGEYVTPSQLGGLPGWVQDNDYPECPGCKHPMRCVGQVGCDDFEEHAEGVYYGFVCVDCRVASAVYQQT